MFAKLKNEQKIIDCLSYKLFYRILPIVLFLSHIHAWSVTNQFGSPQFYPVGLFPSNVVSADFNGDGFPDIAVANTGLLAVSELTMFFNDRNGNFIQSGKYTLDRSSLVSLAVGDFNNDGFNDIVALIQKAKRILIYLNNGDGTLTFQGTYATGNGSTGIAVGNFNGQQSIFVTNASDFNFMVFVGNGNGTFASPILVNTPLSPGAIAVGDINNDGFDEVVIAHPFDNQVSVFLNQNGVYQLDKTYPVQIGPSFVGLKDLNKDNFLDIAVTNSTSNTLSVLLNQRNGTFNAATNYPIGQAPASLSFVDFDGDGTFDITVANQSSSNISLLLNNGNGSFGVAQNFPSNSGPISIATLNPPAKAPTIVVANSTAGGISILTSNIESIFPPINLVGFQKYNKFPTQTDFINVIKWKVPILGLTPVEYRIYRNAALTELVAVIKANQKKKIKDHNRKKDKTYTYFIVSIDAFGRQSVPAEVTVRPNSKRNKIRDPLTNRILPSWLAN